MKKITADELRDHFGLHGNRHMADGSVEYTSKETGIPSDHLLQSIKDAGLSYFLMNEQDHEERLDMAREDWIYVYDREDLQRFLDRNKNTLMEAGWPTKADDFIFYVSYVCAPANSAMFDLIHDCYGGNSKTGENGWLRCNADKLPAWQLDEQRKSAEMSRQRLKAFQQNDRQAARWFLAAAAAGHFGAMIEVSRMYEKGCGFEKNMVEAAFWLKLREALSAETFARSGNKKADFPDPAARRVPPDFRLTKEQEAEIEKRIAAWRPTLPKKKLSGFSWP